MHLIATCANLGADHRWNWVLWFKNLSSTSGQQVCLGKDLGAICLEDFIDGINNIDEPSHAQKRLWISLWIAVWISLCHCVSRCGQHVKIDGGFHSHTFANIHVQSCTHTHRETCMLHQVDSTCCHLMSPGRCCLGVRVAHQQSGSESGLLGVLIGRVW